MRKLKDAPTYSVSILLGFLLIRVTSEPELADSKNAFLSPSVFSKISVRSREGSNIVEYVPISSRKTFRGGFKSWPNTFERFLAQMKLPVFKKVKFFLFTKESKKRVRLNPWNTQALAKSGWNSAENVKILIHGYLQNSQTENMPIQLLKAYQTMNFTENIVLVEWGVLAAQEYFESAMYSQLVGKTLAEFLLVLKNKSFLKTYGSVHIIGFCLGAHVAAAAAYHLKQRVGVGAILGRITGLDPAGPGFHSAPDELSLDSQDADFVDVIHTNGGINFRAGELGIREGIGDADFYPNGGRQQPACAFYLVSPWRSDEIPACNHLKAPDYYKRSIGEEIFRSCPCGSWSAFDTEECSCRSGPYMGEYLQKTVGKFYLNVFEYNLFEMFEMEGLMR